MKILGIIVEYNPFHTGHLYHLQKAKEKGLQVPYTEAVYCLLRTIEETYEMQGF